MVDKDENTSPRSPKKSLRDSPTNSNSSPASSPKSNTEARRQRVTQMRARLNRVERNLRWQKIGQRVAAVGAVAAAAVGVIYYYYVSRH